MNPRHASDPLKASSTPWPSTLALAELFWRLNKKEALVDGRALVGSSKENRYGSRRVRTGHKMVSPLVSLSAQVTLMNKGSEDLELVDVERTEEPVQRPSTTRRVSLLLLVFSPATRIHRAAKNIPTKEASRDASSRTDAKGLELRRSSVGQPQKVEDSNLRWISKLTSFPLPPPRLEILPSQIIRILPNPLYYSSSFLHLPDQTC